MSTAAIHIDNRFTFLHGIEPGTKYILFARQTDAGTEPVPCGHQPGALIFDPDYGQCELWLPLQGEQLAEYNAMKDSIKEAMADAIKLDEAANDE
jgi:hypothetical protein